MDTKLKKIKSGKKSLISSLFCRRNRILVLFGLFGILISFCIVPGGIQLLRNSLYSLLPTAPTTLTLPSNPYDNGKIHGEQCKFSIKLLCNSYLKRIICNGNITILKDRSSKAQKLFALIDPRWSKEIQGLSDGSTVPTGELMLANSFLDIGLARIGCRQVVIDTKELHSKQPQRLMHAHNLDWDNLGGVGNFMVTIFRTASSETRFATLRIGFPSMIGALTIINEKGISLGFNQLGTTKKKSKMPVFIAMRDIAERCKTFKEAEKQLLNMPQGMPFSIMMADAKSGQAAVYERLCDPKIEKRSIINGVLTSNNAAWCNRDISRSPVNQVAKEAVQKSCNNQKPHRKQRGMNQKQIIATRCKHWENEEASLLAIKPTCGINTMKSILRNNKVLLGCNIYSIIFDYNNNIFYLASGSIPAANGKYKKYKLFE